SLTLGVLLLPTTNAQGQPKQKASARKARLAWRGRPRPRGNREGPLLRFRTLDHHELAHAAFVQELDAAGNLGEKSVIFAAADVQARLYPRATLAHDDCSAGNQLSAESLKS